MKEYRIKKKLLSILLCMALVLGGSSPTGILETVAAENGSGTCTITGSITWDDNDDQDGKRPESVEVELFADGEYKQTTTVTAEEDWEYEFENMPVYSTGEEIIYTIDAVGVEGYSGSVYGYDIIFQHTPETHAISGSIIWDDNDDQDGKRPESVGVELFADGVYKQTTTVTAEEDWEYEFENMPVYSIGEEIIYTVAAVGVEGYSGMIAGYDIIFQHTHAISGSITWDDNDDQDGKRPESVEVELFADGEYKQTTTVTAEEDWEYEFENMPVYSTGEEIIYAIAAVGVEGYSGMIAGYDITFQHTLETHAISGSITWDDNNDQDGKRPASVSVKLYANGNKKKDITITAKADWKYTVSDLPKYENGKEIKYTVAADKIEGYTLVVNGYNITASHTPEILDLSKATVKLSASSYTYTGTAKKPTVKSVKLKVGNTTKTLKEGTDYTVSYQNNTNIGTATVTITGKRNYTGTATKTFTIKVKKGTTFMVGANKYKITSSSQVAFTGLKSTKTTKVTIPKTVIIGGKSFQVTAVADKALYEKTKVTSVNIGANVKTIGTSAFEGCKKLSKVTIGSNVTKIGNKAFKSCTALKSITVPGKVTTIGKEAFRGCSKLSSITINSTKLTSVGKNALKGIKSTVKIKVPAKKLKAYKTLLNGKGQGSKVKITN